MRVRLAQVCLRLQGIGGFSKAGAGELIGQKRHQTTPDNSVIINDQSEGVFYARLIFTMTNEVVQKKVVEIDARPSDSVALAAHLGAPLFVATSVWEEVEDMSDVLKQMQSDSGESGDPRIPF